MPVVVAFITPNPGKFDEVEQIFKNHLPKVHQDEPGCELCALHREGDRLIVVGKWADEAAFAAHQQAPHALALEKLVTPLIEPLDFHLLEPIESSGSPKAAL